MAVLGERTNSSSTFVRVSPDVRRTIPFIFVTVHNIGSPIPTQPYPAVNVNGVHHSVVHVYAVRPLMTETVQLRFVRQ